MDIGGHREVFEIKDAKIVESKDFKIKRVIR